VGYVAILENLSPENKEAIPYCTRDVRTCDETATGQSMGVILRKNNECKQSSVIMTSLLCVCACVCA
jgi:hypothetical protein